MPKIMMSRLRAQAAGSTALAGCLVAVMMQVAGGDLARHLPPAPLFQISAGFGAGAAGALLAGGFGHGRWRGHLLGALSAVLATVIGASLGAIIAMGVAARAVQPRVMFDVLEIAPALGLMAIADGVVTSVPVAITWALSLAAVHLLMHQRRQATI
ncbi:hypothetical protein [Tateyamaria sp. SN3-11]|uniref:hypothetical protein n=1 Tax=Tateyamaria sp. SN3-11 TaxID=3092147 RepID=UPI0039ED97DA